MTEQQRRFWRGGSNPRTREWEFRSDDGYIPADDLVGKVVNIGTKDGAVFDSVTVAGFDHETGRFTLTGGRIGSPYSDAEPTPVESARLWVYDIARGYIHEAAGKLTA
jgi:hypothetical protein